MSSPPNPSTDDPVQIPLVGLSTPEARRYGDALLCLIDIQKAQQAVRALLQDWRPEGKAPPNTWALWNAALISYVRAFSGGVRGYNMHKHLGSLGKGAPEAHKYLKNIRDKHIAHSVNSMSQIRVGVLIGSAPDYPILGQGHMVADRTTESREFLVQFESMLTAIQQEMAPDLQALSEAVLASAHALTPRQRANLKTAAIRVDGPDAAGLPRRGVQSNPHLPSDE